MKPRSAKHKGRRFQQAVRRLILEQFPHLADEDVQVVSRSEPGTDIKLSPAAQSVFPYSVECKNVERLNIWSALAQAQDNAEDGMTPLLVFARNRTEPYVAMKLTEFMTLLPPPPPIPPRGP
jgi:hypothetical protein